MRSCRESLKPFPKHPSAPVKTLHLSILPALRSLVTVSYTHLALFHRADNRCKIIVRQHHICHIFGNVRSCDAHSDADVRSLDGGRVVNAVTGHCRHIAGISPGVYNTVLVLWLYAGINACLLYTSSVRKSYISSTAFTGTP